jgi:RNA polymerase sigma factor (sigma-70 family)
MDRALVERAMAGDRDAFNDLARESIGRLYGIAQLVLRDPDRAADATQDALVAAWRDLSALRDPDRFDAWLHRVLIRTCRREARLARRQRTVEVEDAFLAEQPGSDDLPAMLDRDELDRAFRRLDVDQRAIVVLHHLEGYTLLEVAGLLGIPVGTAKSRLHRAVRTMRASLDADARVVPFDRERIA